MRASDCILVRRLIDFVLTFPLPSALKDILREQVTDATFTVEHYDDCFKILFEHKKGVKTFPTWVPFLIQSCQFLKDGCPLSCQLFVEKGYVVQFEVVDMGLHKIDWGYLWEHDPIFDIEYDFGYIKNQLELEEVNITNFWKEKTSVSLEVDTNGCHHTIQLNGCTVRAFPTAGTLCDCKLQINSECHDEPPYTIFSADGEIDIMCSLIGLQNRP